MFESTWQAVLLAYFIVGWLLRIIMLFVVPRNKEPSSAIAWLLLIIIEPVIGTLAFAAFGEPRLPSSRRNSYTNIDTIIGKELAQHMGEKPDMFGKPAEPELGEIEKLAASLGGLPSMSGNKVRVITDYDEMLALHVQAINKARSYVHIEYFILTLDEKTEPIFAAMERAVNRGVHVRLLIDRMGSVWYPNYRETRKRLNRIGVDWHDMLPFRLLPGKNFTRPDLRNHRKLMVVDGLLAYCGSLNIISRNYHRRDKLIYEEMLLELTGPIVWQCNNVFRSDWYAETKNLLLESVKDAGLPPKTGKVVAQVMPSGPGHQTSNNLMIYTALFYAAKKSISIVVPYFVPDESVMQAVKAAAKRGVQVTIINSEIIDKLLTGHAQRSYYEELLQAGINVYLYRSPVFLHNKQVIIDDRVAMFGSSNLDIRSFELNFENSILLYDKQVVASLERIDSGYKQKSMKLDLETWQQRPLRLRMLERLARLTSSLQ